MNEFEKLLIPFENEVVSLLKFYNSNSYSPYSNFKVSSCLVIRKQDKIHYIGGSNVENSSYGLSICAERNAVFKCISEGLAPRDNEVSWLFIALFVPVKNFVSPCGACRQVISEFIEDIPIVIYNQQFQKKIVLLNDIFKEKFSPKDLKK
ncbi:MAG: cytidine deaminase [bacterium]|nr:cytidine deaminase [bacterium]